MGRCASPGCREEPEPDKRFCAEHQALLDRVRGELEAAARFSEYRRGRRRVAAGPSEEPETDDGELDSQVI